MEFPKPLKCFEVGDRKVLEALLKGELKQDEENRLLKHLKTCPACLSEMALMISQGSFFDPGDTLVDFPNQNL